MAEKSRLEIRLSCLDVGINSIIIIIFLILWGERVPFRPSYIFRILPIVIIVFQRINLVL